MTEEDKKLLTEFLGECWHKPVMEYFNKSNAGDFRCVCGYGTFYYEYLIAHINKKENNPDFTSEAGRVQLLKLLPTETLISLLLDKNKPSLIQYMKNDKGLFRNAVFERLGGEG